MKKYPTVQHGGVSVPLKSLAEQRFESPRLSVINQDILTKIVTVLITETYLKCGQDISKNELETVSSLFTKELHIFPYLTIKELQKCFSDGYKERYGKYYGLSVKTFIGWIDYYIQNTRNDVLNKLKKPTIAKIEETPESEKQRLIQRGMRKCLEFYENERRILDDYGVFLYMNFEDDGFLVVNDEIKKKFYNDAKTFLKMQYQSSKATNKRDFSAIKEAKLAIEKPKSPIVIKKAKEMIVERFLRETYSDKIKLNKLKLKYMI